MADKYKNDFSKGSVAGHIVKLAIPLTVAQFVNVLYNIVDRIYIGLIPGEATLSLTGIGLGLPIITIIIAFANLFGMGGSPLCSIARGEGDNEEAEKIMGNSFGMLVIVGLILTALCMIFHKPMLYLFGASDDTYPYAAAYIMIYLLGSVFVMISLGMNPFINSQGFAKIGMLTVLIGAVANIILDPVFIFVFRLGVRGVAIATVIAQFLSAAWIVKFLVSDKAILKLKLSAVKPEWKRVKRIIGLGTAGFTQQITNATVQIMCNATLAAYGGDLYVAVMTVINSVREIFQQPIHGITHGAQPVIGYNYGAKEYKRVKNGIVVMSVMGVAYTVLCWGAVNIFPEPLIKMFNRDPELVAAAVPAIKLYYFGYFMMSLQFCGQAVFTGLGKAKNAIFFSIFRKVIIVVPLTVLLPGLFHMGVNGVFIAEPVSNAIGGMACYVTMLMVVWRELSRKEKEMA